MQFKYVVYDRSGRVAAQTTERWEAEQEAARVGGTWRGLTSNPVPRQGKQGRKPHTTMGVLTNEEIASVMPDAPRPPRIIGATKPVRQGKVKPAPITRRSSGEGVSESEMAKLMAMIGQKPVKRTKPVVKPATPKPSVKPAPTTRRSSGEGVSESEMARLMAMIGQKPVKRTTTKPSVKPVVKPATPKPSVKPVVKPAPTTRRSSGEGVSEAEMAKLMAMIGQKPVKTVKPVKPTTRVSPVAQPEPPIVPEEAAAAGEPVFDPNLIVDGDESTLNQIVTEADLDPEGLYQIWDWNDKKQVWKLFAPDQYVGADFLPGKVGYDYFTTEGFAIVAAGGDPNLAAVAAPTESMFACDCPVCNDYRLQRANADDFGPLTDITTKWCEVFAPGGGQTTGELTAEDIAQIVDEAASEEAGYNINAIVKSAADIDPEQQYLIWLRDKNGYQLGDETPVSGMSFMPMQQYETYLDDPSFAVVQVGGDPNLAGKRRSTPRVSSHKRVSSPKPVTRTSPVRTSPVRTSPVRTSPVAAAPVPVIVGGKRKPGRPPKNAPKPVAAASAPVVKRTSVEAAPDEIFAPGTEVMQKGINQVKIVNAAFPKGTKDYRFPHYELYRPGKPWVLSVVRMSDVTAVGAEPQAVRTSPVRTSPTPTRVSAVRVSPARSSGSVPCDYCLGSGKDERQCRVCGGSKYAAACSTCGGMGVLADQTTEESVVECPSCKGAALVDCPECEGVGAKDYPTGLEYCHAGCKEGKIPCPECEGLGMLQTQGTTPICPDCNGDALVEAVPFDEGAGECPICSGGEKACPACLGSGKLPSTGQLAEGADPLEAMQYRHWREKQVKQNPAMSARRKTELMRRAEAISTHKYRKAKIPAEMKVAPGYVVMESVAAGRKPVYAVHRAGDSRTAGPFASQSLRAAVKATWDFARLSGHRTLKHQ